MFSLATSSGLPNLFLAFVFYLVVVEAVCLPCQVGQVSLTFKTPSSTLSRRGVWSPSIIKPDASTKWTRGTEANVTWSTSDIPKSITNPKGTILLGRLEAGSSNEHLDVDHPLADGFDLSDGYSTFTVPIVPPRHNYIVVLMGDSGNHSPIFTIE
ncbi:hypothetical protein C8R43DRAFT_542417 [Mycena crocata]|nr:hypothetical protein C8R43DRAFT_542417 [Mycena crocata]